MDVFRFYNQGDHPMKMQDGQIINGLRSKTWVERYAQSGEFTFVCDASVAMREYLPVGCFVSHVDSTEVMMVENHEIKEGDNQIDDLVITGRGLESLFEGRIVGSNRSFPISTGPTDYALAANPLSVQIVNLINDHILASSLLDDNDALPYITVTQSVSGTEANEARTLKIGDLYTRVQDLLAVGKLGIKVYRPGPWSPLGVGDPNVNVVIQNGTDQSGTIVFSHDTGEINHADYLWSNKKVKNAALVTGKWVQTVVTNSEVEQDRRMMMVDGTDIDQNFSTAPVGTDLTNVIAAMQQRGQQALSKQIEVALTNIDVAKSTKWSVYRHHFDLGDLITVTGSYNETTQMMISEYVEIEDQSGSISFPTLTVV